MADKTKQTQAYALARRAATVSLIFAAYPEVQKAFDRVCQIADRLHQAGKAFTTEEMARIQAESGNKRKSLGLTSIRRSAASWSGSDPYEEDIGFLHAFGVRVRIEAAEDGSPIVKYCLGPDRKPDVVRVPPQELIPWPDTVLLEVDWRAPDTALVADFKSRIQELREEATRAGLHRNGAKKRLPAAAELDAAAELLRAQRRLRSWRRVAEERGSGFSHLPTIARRALESAGLEIPEWTGLRKPRPDHPARSKCCEDCPTRACPDCPLVLLDEEMPPEPGDKNRKELTFDSKKDGETRGKIDLDQWDGADIEPGAVYYEDFLPPED